MTEQRRKSQCSGLSSAALKSMAQKIDDLPLLPQVLIRVMQLDPTDDDYFEHFEELAQEDPAVAVKVIAFANSAVSSPSDPVLSIRCALTRMGIQPVRSLIASLAVQRVFVPTEESQIRLWRHSIGTAVLSEFIAAAWQDHSIDTGTAYLAGLLHDVGRFVMFEHAPQDLLLADEENWASPQDLISADIEIFKFTHSELGFLACEHWGLPGGLASVIRRHHEEIEPPFSAEDRLVLCVQLADWLTVRVLPDEGFADKEVDQRTELMRELCPVLSLAEEFIDISQLSRRLPFLRSETESLLSGLNL